MKVYDDEYAKQESAGLSPSISSLVYAEISQQDQHPIDAAFRLHPNETMADQQFFRQVDAMIGSIHC